MAHRLVFWEMRSELAVNLYAKSVASPPQQMAAIIAPLLSEKQAEVRRGHKHTPSLAPPCPFFPFPLPLPHVCLHSHFGLHSLSAQPFSPHLFDPSPSLAHSLHFRSNRSAQLVRMIDPTHAEEMVLAVLVASCDAYERVLLDGGRSFTFQDGQLLEEVRCQQSHGAAHTPTPFPPSAAGA